jgi:hypothetical protein
MTMKEGEMDPNFRLLPYEAPKYVCVISEGMCVLRNGNGSSVGLGLGCAIPKRRDVNCTLLYLEDTGTR